MRKNINRRFEKEKKEKGGSLKDLIQYATQYKIGNQSTVAPTIDDLPPPPPDDLLTLDERVERDHPVLKIFLPNSYKNELRRLRQKRIRSLVDFNNGFIDHHEFLAIYRQSQQRRNEIIRETDPRARWLSQDPESTETVVEDEDI